MMKPTPLLFFCMLVFCISFSACKKCYTCTGIKYCSACKQYNYSTLGTGQAIISTVANDCNDQSTYVASEFSCRQLMQTNTAGIQYNWVNTDSSVQTIEKVCNVADEEAYTSRRFSCY